LNSALKTAIVTSRGTSPTLQFTTDEHTPMKLAMSRKPRRFALSGQDSHALEPRHLLTTVNVGSLTGLVPLPNHVELSIGHAIVTSSHVPASSATPVVASGQAHRAAHHTLRHAAANHPTAALASAATTPSSAKTHATAATSATVGRVQDAATGLTFHRTRPSSHTLTQPVVRSSSALAAQSSATAVSPNAASASSVVVTPPTPVINHTATDYIGSYASFGITNVPTDPTLPLDTTITITSVKWTISGGPVEYASSNDPPNAAQGAFSHVTYDVTAQHGSSISFYFGEIPGTANVQADVTYSDGSTKTAKFADSVTLPTYQSTITGVPSSSIVVDPNTGYPTLAYGDSNPKSSAPAGLTWSVTTAAPGQLGVVQLVSNPTGRLSTDPRRISTTRVQLFAKRDPNTNALLTPPDPLVDSAPAGGVFYSGTGAPSGSSNDSPATRPLDPAQGWFNVTYSASFKDVVMWKPTGGMWVPLASWSWAFNASATMATGVWVAKDVTPPTLTPIVNDSTWPTWKDVASNWLNSSVTL